MENHHIAHLLSQTLSSDGNVVNSATEALGRLSTLPTFPTSLLSIVTGGETESQKLASATYLKNLIRRNANGPNPEFSKEFRDALMRALFQTEPAILNVLIEAFHSIIAIEFVNKSSWPELVPELRFVIQNSNLISDNGNLEWKTINSLTVLQSLIRPFQYFLSPTIVREPVPPQLELIAKEILVPLFAVFHHFVEKVLHVQDIAEAEIHSILIFTKCIYLSVRSHMPPALAPLLPSICRDLLKVLNSLSFDGEVNCKSDLFRLKTGKRSLLIFSVLVTRHRKISDKLMPDIVDCATKIVKHSTNISTLDSLSEKVVSLAFDVISRVLETGQGWRVVSPHFSSLLDSAIFPALVRNTKDMSEWDEDPEEYIKKNLPSELEEISGWREDLSTARKSAINLLGVISMAKGPPVSSNSSKRKKGEKRKKATCSSIGELLVLPFLSKFPVPTDANVKTVNEYYGVLMAYGSLLDFLKVEKPGYTATLLQTRLLALYRASIPEPYLIASANWVLGELASCLPEEMRADIYSALVDALVTPDRGDVSCYPVRVSAAGAIAQLVENDYMPPEWLSLLQVIVGRISDDEGETSISLQLLSTLAETGDENIAPHIPHIVTLLVTRILNHTTIDSNPWPQVVKRVFATLGVMAQCWRDSATEENENTDADEMWLLSQRTLMEAFTAMLQHAWLKSAEMECEPVPSELPSSSVDDASRLLAFVLHGITEKSEIAKLKIMELLHVWSDLIANWHAWEEMEDLSIFDCINEAVNLTRKLAVKNFNVGEFPSRTVPHMPRRSIIEGIGVFVVEAFSQYTSAVWRASACVHMLLHGPDYSLEGESIKQSLAVSLTTAAFTRFRETQSKPVPLWKPLLLAISSCYLSCPDIVAKRLENIQSDGFTVFASALAYICSSKFEHSLSTESSFKLAVMALERVAAKLTQQSGDSNLLQSCVVSLIEASVRLKEMQEGEEESENEDCSDGDTEEDEDDEDDSEEDDEREETEEEFLERYAETAIALENETIHEGDEENEEYDIIELGCMERFDLQSTVVSFLERLHQVILQGQVMPPPELMSQFLEYFPECRLYFPQLQQH
ncbi:unnamed protein product [Cuscuta epithymum]|uniref:Importin N-terminal domain-containing protein n=1 Tax=Cuscuta epithymum TaxID=186058 RepID=A0AAV0E9Q8_9ASTE|nr:unnamed protein product [Cuscuta epithymum]